MRVRFLCNAIHIRHFSRTNTVTNEIHTNWDIANGNADVPVKTFDSNIGVSGILNTLLCRVFVNQ